jgi:hypothetical protein
MVSTTHRFLYRLDWQPLLAHYLRSRIGITFTSDMIKRVGDWCYTNKMICVVLEGMRPRFVPVSVFGAIVAGAREPLDKAKIFKDAIPYKSPAKPEAAAPLPRPTRQEKKAAKQTAKAAKRKAAKNQPPAVAFDATTTLADPTFIPVGSFHPDNLELDTERRHRAVRRLAAGYYYACTGYNFNPETLTVKQVNTYIGFRLGLLDEDDIEWYAKTLVVFPG